MIEAKDGAASERIGVVEQSRQEQRHTGMNRWLAVAALIVPALALALGACGASGPPGVQTGTPSATAGTPTTVSATAVYGTPPAAEASGTATRPETTPAPSASAIPGESGVEGVVLAGPTCPVERIDSPCPDRPVSLTLGFYTATHSTPASPVATTTSGADGQFRVALPPGTYVVQRACGPQNCTQFPSLRPVMVEVRPGGYIRVTLQADTGIR